jgi:L-ribulokinase
MYQHFAQLFKGEPIEKIQKKLIEELALSKRHTPIIVIPWWRGSRTPVADSNFTGIILGLTEQTKPIDIYQGMLEATAFATQEVIEMLAEKKMKVKKLILAGGIPLKNQAQVQTYAYTFGQEVSVAKNHGCLGPAILAAAASGYYPDIGTAQDALTNFYQPIICQPTDKKLKNIYRQKFLVYQKLSRLLATQGAAALKSLKGIQLNNY